MLHSFSIKKRKCRHPKKKMINVYQYYIGWWMQCNLWFMCVRARVCMSLCLSHEVEKKKKLKKYTRNEDDTRNGYAAVTLCTHISMYIYLYIFIGQCFLHSIWVNIHQQHNISNGWICIPNSQTLANWYILKQEYHIFGSVRRSTRTSCITIS